MTEQDYLEIIYDQTRMIEDLNQMVSKLAGELEQLKGVLGSSISNPPDHVVHCQFNAKKEALP